MKNIYRIREKKFADGKSQFYPEVKHIEVINPNKKKYWIFNKFLNRNKTTKEVEGWIGVLDSIHIMNEVGYDTIEEAQQRIDYREKLLQAQILRTTVVEEKLHEVSTKQEKRKKKLNKLDENKE